MFLSKFVEICALGFCIMRRLPNKNLRFNRRTVLINARQTHINKRKTKDVSTRNYISTSVEV